MISRVHVRALPPRARFGTQLALLAWTSLVSQLLQPVIGFAIVKDSSTKAPPLDCTACTKQFVSSGGCLKLQKDDSVRRIRSLRLSTQ